MQTLRPEYQRNHENQEGWWQESYQPVSHAWSADYVTTFTTPLHTGTMSDPAEMLLAFRRVFALPYPSSALCMSLNEERSERRQPKNGVAGVKREPDSPVDLPCSSRSQQRSLKTNRQTLTQCDGCMAAWVVPCTL